jgi:hypothetical protein
MKANHIVASLCLAGMPWLAGCSAVLVAGAPSYDAGSFGVSGTDTGVGGHIEAIGYRDGAGSARGVGAAFSLAGYSASNDADPIAFTTLEVRFRHRLRPSSTTGVYWEAGTGGGVAWAAGPRAAAMVAQFEVGAQRQAGSVLLFGGVRERFVATVGSGSPAWDAFNSAQIVAGLGFGRKRPRPSGGSR